jgi:hypothetical protein
LTECVFIRFKGNRYRALIWTEGHCFLSTETLSGGVGEERYPSALRDALKYRVSRRGKVVEHPSKGDALEALRKWRMDCSANDWLTEVALTEDDR